LDEDLEPAYYHYLSINFFTNVPVLSLVVAKHCTDDARIVRDERIKGIDASHSRYSDLVNDVGNGGAVLRLGLFLRARVAAVGVAKAVGGDVAVTAITLLIRLAPMA